MNRSRAPRTKTAIYEITKELTANGADSRQIVDRIKLDHSDLLTAEAEDLLDYALMLLAGRMASKPIIDETQYSFLPDEKPNEFHEIATGGEGHWETKRWRSVEIPMHVWDSRRIRQPKPAQTKKSKEQILEEKFEEMKRRGAGPNETIQSFFGN